MRRPGTRVGADRVAEAVSVREPAGAVGSLQRSPVALHGDDHPRDDPDAGFRAGHGEQPQLCPRRRCAHATSIGEGRAIERPSASPQSSGGRGRSSRGSRW